MLRDEGEGVEMAEDLLTAVTAFAQKQEHGALGYFDAIGPGPIPAQWDPENAERLSKHGVAFLHLPDGSLLATLDTGAPKAPKAVVLLGSEGDMRTVATSLEEFLVLWSKGETDINELDDEEAFGRRDLVKWLKARKVKVPKAPPFDFAAWLDGSANTKAPAITEVRRAPTQDFSRLGPKVQHLVSMMGRRADDPVLVEWVTKTLGKKVPTSDHSNVSAPKLGLEIAFSADILNEKYPLVSKARSSVPYLSTAWIGKKFGEKVFGFEAHKETTEAALAAVLGPPTGTHDIWGTYWRRIVDRGADVVVSLELSRQLKVVVTLLHALDLDRFPTPSTHLFLAWAAKHNLLDEARFSAHASLLAKVKKRAALGSELAKAALPRGLWDDHLRNDADLRTKAWQWFQNMEGLWITKDLKKIFGRREGPHGHDEPVLDDDGWDKVDAAAPAFEKVFGRFLK